MSAEDEQLEYAGDLARALPGSGRDMPVYAQTPHGNFVVQRVEVVEHEGEDVAVLVLTEVTW